jgi:hypothetical protein
MAMPRRESSSGILGRSKGFSVNSVPRERNVIENTALVESFFFVLCAVLGIVQLWISRYAMNPDGISYLDVGDAYLRGDWAAAVNGYWSPMYSWCLGLALYVLKPSLRREFIIVHLVNFIIYLAALLCFRFFLYSVLRAVKEQVTECAEGTLPLPDWVLLGLGYSVFLWASLVLIDPGLVTPDLLVAAIVFLIGGYLVELRVHESYGKFGMFGVLCGAAYLGKAIMFPLGFGFLGILLLSGRSSKRRTCGVLLSALLFLIVSSPFIAALSQQKGRLTFGDSGRLNYASLVNPGASQVHWQGEPVGSGVPLHTTRKLLDNPPVYEFGEPVAGTYPPWYDPSYWNDGARPSFRLRAQTRVLVQSALTYATALVGSQLGLIAGLLVFILHGGAPTRRAIIFNWPLIAAAGLSIGTYSLVLVRSRYIGASVVLLLLGILAGIRLPKNEQFGAVAKHVTAAIIATILFSVVAHVAETTYKTMTVDGNPNQQDQLEVAIGLQSLGLAAGERVAVIGDGSFDIWARLARFRIVSEVSSVEPGNREFWASSWERRSLVYQKLRGTGAKVVVVWSPPANGMDPGWRKVASTNYYAHFLSK